MKRARVQNGSVVFNKRYGTWNFLWTEKDKRRSRKLGDLSELPTKQSALRKAEAVRMELRFQPPTSVPRVKTLVEQYRAEKMPSRYSTRRGYEVWLKNHILPRWGEQPITALQPRPVEIWLSSMDLSPKSRGPYSGATTHNLGLCNVERARSSASKSDFARNCKRLFEAYPAASKSHGRRVPEVLAGLGRPVSHHLPGVRLLWPPHL